jgi:hypothetical protein
MNKLHRVKNIEFYGNQLILEIDGEKKIFDLSAVSKILSKASDIEKSTFEISPSGYGIHWPLIDEDISIDGLLGVVHQPKLETVSA